MTTSPIRRPWSPRQEKRESVLYAEFERHLEKLLTLDWKEGVSGLLLLLNHSLILQKPLEFIELKKSIYYNLAMICKEKIDHKNALYFYFSFYKLNPDNVSIIVEIAILSKKEMMLEQSLYFFELAFSKDNSPAMKLIYLEQIAILNFILGFHHEALQKINILIGADFKKNLLSELGQFIVEEMSDSNKDKFDFFNPSYQYYPPLEGAAEARKLPFVNKIIELRDEYGVRRLQAAKLYWLDPHPAILQNSLEMKEEFITVTIPKPRWKEILNSMLMILKIHKLKTAGSNVEDIKSKIEKSSSFKYLSSLDFDIFDTRFQFNLVAPPPAIITPFINNSPLKVEELIKEKPREERYGGGQMSLREKKSSNKAPEIPANTSELSFTKGLEQCIQTILKESLDLSEQRFFQSELNNLIGGLSATPSVDSQQPEVISFNKDLLRKFSERDDQDLCGASHQ